MSQNDVVDVFSRSSASPPARSAASGRLIDVDSQQGVQNEHGSPVRESEIPLLYKNWKRVATTTVRRYRLGIIRYQPAITQRLLDRTIYTLFYYAYRQREARFSIKSTGSSSHDVVNIKNFFSCVLGFYGFGFFGL